MTDLKVAVPWWTPRSVGGSQQAIRGNVRGFLHMGADVDLYVIGNWQDALPIADRADEYDLILWPFLQEGLETDDGEGHVHSPIGGFGPADLDGELAARTFDMADSVSFLDPKLAVYFEDLAGVDLSECYHLLNPPNWDLFERRYTGRGHGHVLVPKVGGSHKTGQHLATVASNALDIAFETSVVQPVSAGQVSAPPNLPGNVRIRAGVPYTAMDDRYREASVVFNCSEREAGPNVAYEAFLTGRPFVATPGGIGHHKSKAADTVDMSDVGAPMDYYLEKHRDTFYTGAGEHYRAADPDDLHVHLRELLEDEEAWRSVNKAAGKWLDALVGYDWQARAETIVAIMEET